MADDPPREALARRTRSDLAGLVADTWAERGWSVSRGESEGADLVARRDGAYAERLAIVLAEPGTQIEPATVQRAAGIRQQEVADVVLLVGTEAVTDAARTLAKRETLNVKVIDGWALCRELETQGLLGRLEDGPSDGSTGTGGAESDPAGGTQGAPGQDRGGEARAEGAATNHREEGTATAASVSEDGGPSDPSGSIATSDSEESGAKTATDNETPCPSCGEAIFRPLIEQGLQCPYCDADFES